jgi:hypothetical protein
VLVLALVEIPFEVAGAVVPAKRVRGTGALRLGVQLLILEGSALVFDTNEGTFA